MKLVTKQLETSTETFVNGTTNLVPDENSYNVLTLLMDLSEGDGNYLDISHESFEYNAIGGKRVTAETESGFKPVFKDKEGQVKAAISSLKFDEDRPNINILVRREGTVSLPDNELGFGNSFESFIWCNYAIVADGIVNVRFLPLILSKATYDLFFQLGVITEPFKIGYTYVIDTKKYPIINRSMVKPTKASDLFGDCFDLFVLRTTQKVLNSKITTPEIGQKFAALYGDEGAKFLKDFGITEGGFSPKTIKGESIDPYVSKVLEIKLSSLSTIPKIEDVNTSITAGKVLTPSQKIMSDVFDSLSSLTTEKEYIAELKKNKEKIRELMNKIVMTKFGVIVGKMWFTDISIETPELTFEWGLGKPIKCQAVMSDKKV